MEDCSRLITFPVIIRWKNSFAYTTIYYKLLPCFELFATILNVLKLVVESFLSNFMFFLRLNESFSNIASNSASLYTFGGPLGALSSTSNLLILTYVSILFRSRFPQTKAVIQKFPRMTFIRLKTPIFAQKKWRYLYFVGLARWTILQTDFLWLIISTVINWWGYLLSKKGDLFVLLDALLIMSCKCELLDSNLCTCGLYFFWV